MNISWEQQPVPDATLNDIDEDVVKKFVQKAISINRISENAANDKTLTVLKNLELVSSQDELLLAAFLLFGKKPTKYAVHCSFKIGRFVNTDSDLRFQDVIEGNILGMADEVMQKLKDRYLIRPISYKGLERMEPREYPEKALREAILNSIIHKDQSRANVFLSVYNDRLMIWNPGGLPPSLSIEKLKEKHGSEPRNGLIARVFFMAGYIESWGRGIETIFEGCKEYGMPEPVLAEEQEGFCITFLKDIFTEEYLNTLELKTRQVKALLYVKEKAQITNSEYQKINNIGKSVSATELLDLVNRQLLVRIGSTGRSSKYVLPKG